MYSVVLMAALTAGSAAPDCHWFRGCHGGYGGCHGGYGGCYGGFNSWYGGCYGGGSYGYGCYGCGGYGGAGYGYGAYTPVSYGCYGCYGGYGGYGCYGCYGGVPYAAPYVAPQTYLPPQDTKGAEQVPPPKKTDKESMGTYRAKVLVQLPADAKLYIDDHLMKATSDLRTFQTPKLEPGQVYYYVLRAEVVRDGQKKVETARVILRPGQEVRAAFNTLDTVTTSTVQATKD